MTVLLLPVLAASLAGSLHCAAMCGPFMAAAGGAARPATAKWQAQAAYHVGRLIIYVMLGAAAGGLGRVLDLAGALAGLGQLSALMAGVTMVAWAIRAVMPRPKLLTLGRRPRRGARASERWLGELMVGAGPGHHGTLRHGVLLGLATTLVPCGWLYAFVVTAAGTGTVLSAMLVMGAFWLGTVPLMLGVSFGIHTLATRLGGQVRALSACLVAATGVATIVLRAGAPLGAPWNPSPDARGSTTETPAADCPLHPR